MLRKAKAKIEITKVHNGYIVEWEREKTAEEKRRRQSFSAMGGDFEDNWPTVSAIEIIPTQAALIKRLKELT